MRLAVVTTLLYGSRDMTFLFRYGRLEMYLHTIATFIRSNFTERGLSALSNQVAVNTERFEAYFHYLLDEIANHVILSLVLNSFNEPELIMFHLENEYGDAFV